MGRRIRIQQEVSGRPAADFLIFLIEDGWNMHFQSSFKPDSEAFHPPSAVSADYSALK
ncbi:hypothetical protein D1AOALGA4SA_507 [Olavius algarvensis Delta 1 endosymbiont]|nr:hypothetical protein D1AOALGA4SA_507 [Olavius algarvensis Delta 1 endosymbiont]